MPQTEDEEKLLKAAKKGDLDGVNAALAAGVNVDTQDTVRGRGMPLRAAMPLKRYLHNSTFARMYICCTNPQLGVRSAMGWAV